MQAVYLAGDSRKDQYGCGEPDREGKESGKLCIIAVGQQELNSPGPLQPTQNTSLGVKKVLVYLSLAPY